MRRSELRLGALVEHRDDRADHLEVAQLLGGDVHQHVLAARIVVAQPLREIAHRRRELAVGAAKLFEDQGAEHRIRLGYPDGILQALVVHEHRRHSLWTSGQTACARSEFRPKRVSITYVYQ